MMLTDRLLHVVAAHPGRTAWGIAKTLSDDPFFLTGSSSSLLCKMARDGRLRRRKNRRGSWTYRLKKE
jgi:hypothetical protein